MSMRLFSTLLLILSWASGLAAGEHSAGPSLGPYNTCLWDFLAPSYWSSPPPEPAHWPPASTPLGPYNTCLWDFSAHSYWSSPPPEPADLPPASTPQPLRWALITHVYGFLSTLLLILSSAWASGLAAGEHTPYWSSPPPEPADWPPASTPLPLRWALITHVYGISQHTVTHPLLRLRLRTGRPWAFRWPLITHVYGIFQHPLTDPLLRLKQRTGRLWALRWPTAGTL